MPFGLHVDRGEKRDKKEKHIPEGMIYIAAWVDTNRYYRGDSSIVNL
jgi:hypothetical protein